MDNLSSAGKIAKLGVEAVDALMEAAKQITNRQELLKALREYEESGKGKIATLITKLGVDGDRFKQFLGRNDSRLSLLLGKVGDLAEGPISWSIEASNKAVGAVASFEIDAAATATVYADVDGDLFGDGSVEFEPATESFACYEVSGKVSGGAKIPDLPIGGMVGKAAFGAEASLLLGSYFPHSVSEDALVAIAHDVRAFRLPSVPESLAPDQILRIHGTGSVAISGEISWGKAFVAGGTVEEKALSLGATEVSAEAKLAATFSFSAETGGDLSILVSRDQDLVRVRLTKSSASKHATRISATAGVDIKGVDRVAKSILAQITSPLNDLLKILEADSQRFSNLKELFDDYLGDQASKLLNKPSVADQIQGWLTAIAPDIDLRERLRTLLVNAVDEKIGGLVDDIQSNLNKLTGHVKTLIARYQQALGKLTKAVEAAARVKIGVELSRKTTSFKKDGAAIDISLDVSTRRETYLKMLRGDFTEALSLARQGANGIRLNGGHWMGSGGLSIESSLSISAFGSNVGVGTLLKQDWNYDISVTGELSFGLRASLESWSRSWRSLRSLTVLADTRLLAVLSSANSLLDPQTSESVTVESSIAWSPTPKELDTWESKMLALGILARPANLRQELVKAPASKKPSGEIICSAALTLNENELRAVAATKPADALLEFATRLQVHYLAGQPSPFAEYDGRIPFLLWPSVREWAESASGTSTFHDNLEFASGTRQVQVSEARLHVVALASRIVTSFERVHQRLQKLESASLAGLSVEEALASLRIEQRKLMGEFKNIVAATQFDREALGFALFMTLWKLAGTSIAPFVVVHRAQDDTRLVLGP